MALTKINKDQVQTGVWTSTNLTAGTNISFTEVPQPLIDSNTVALFHFDNNTNNEINNNYVVDSSLTPLAFDSTNYKFGGYSAYSPAGSSASTSAITSSITGITQDFTIDFWARYAGTSTSYSASLAINGSGMYTIKPYNSSTTARIQINSSMGGNATVDTSKFNHFAIVHKDGHPYFFINGKLVYSNPNSTYTNPTTSLKLQIPYTANLFLIDELRVSNVARWITDFDVWTQPYTSNGDPVYSINTTGVATSTELTAGLATKQDTLSENQLNNIQYAYTQQNLIGGKNISIDDVPAPTIDANTLALYHFDGNYDNAIENSVFTHTAQSTASVTNTINISSYKFGNGSASTNVSNQERYICSSTSNGIGTTGDCTVDFWLYRQQDQNGTCYAYIWAPGRSYLIIFSSLSDNINIHTGEPSISSTKVASSGTSGNGWHHCALERYNGVLNTYVDGIKLYSTSNTANLNQLGISIGFGGTTVMALDELRISNVARYQGNNFTPWDQPYGGSGQKAINYTGTGSDSNVSLVAGTGITIDEDSDSDGIVYTISASGASSAITKNTYTLVEEYGHTFFVPDVDDITTPGTYNIVLDTTVQELGLDIKVPTTLYVVSIMNGAALLQSLSGAMGEMYGIVSRSFQDNTWGNWILQFPSPEIVKDASNYNPMLTQVLKNVEGTLTWASDSGGGSSSLTRKNYTGITGTTLATGLTLSSFTTILVYKNGILFTEAEGESDESDYDANDYIISGNNIIFGIALEASDKVAIVAM